ncbi:hypothetical protein RJZ56_003543 [Blastomyces dermatitidis]|uniref:Plasma membrane antiporter n=1 Tax=Ajellomyces dermatitidis (strain ATCC 18188 / CBS 674.68) TaxID=653446 RepID=F2TMJ8_AJEDA|nr:plasma membrane antiporter [Blastomyces dermatitidis ATCC 18188]
MPLLNVSELNVVLSILGAFIVLYGSISTKIRNVWYLGEALPAVIFGILLGPLAAKFIEVEHWGSAAEDQKYQVTLGVARVVIGVQLVIAGFQLPAKYQLARWKEMALCLLPIMTIMWLCTTGCILLTIPNLTLLAALVIGSCVTCTDPILSQAIAKGPFADKYVDRDLREIISSEAGANDGFGFPFLMLATYLIRYADVPGAGENIIHKRSGEIGRLGGGVCKAIGMWFLETWLYTVLMSVVYGAICGYGSCLIMKFCLRKKWIDNESFMLWPCALGLFILGTCGALGTDDLLACFVAGNALNWDGEYLAESETRHDEVNSCIDVLLNFGGFMYIGAIIPWSEFNQPEFGITYPRLVGLGFLVLFLRRLPAILVLYKLMPKVCKNWKEALFMGYYGPIGVGAVFYLEHARHLFPKFGEGDLEETNLIRALSPVVYWLVLFSIVVHGISIPVHNVIYKIAGINPIVDKAGPVEITPPSRRMSLPKNSMSNKKRNSITVYNRFSRGNPAEGQSSNWELPTSHGSRVRDDQGEQIEFQSAYSRPQPWSRKTSIHFDVGGGESV